MPPAVQNQKQLWIFSTKLESVSFWFSHQILNPSNISMKNKLGQIYKVGSQLEPKNRFSFRTKVGVSDSTHRSHLEETLLDGIKGRAAHPHIEPTQSLGPMFENWPVWLIDRLIDWLTNWLVKLVANVLSTVVLTDQLTVGTVFCQYLLPCVNREVEVKGGAVCAAGGWIVTHLTSDQSALWLTYWSWGFALEIHISHSMSSVRSKLCISKYQLFLWSTLMTQTL